MKNHEFKVILEGSNHVHTYSQRDFELFFGIRYIDCLEYADWKVEQQVRKLCAGAERKGWVGNLAKWLGQLHAKEMDDALVPDVTVRFISKQKGYGVITNCFIKKWAFIGEYTGLVRRRRIFFPKLSPYSFQYPKEWRSLKYFSIDSEKEGNITRFINHSDYPNCESVSVFKDGVFHIIFRATEDIMPGTELIYDYGESYWNKRIKIPEKQPVHVFTS